MDSKDKRFGGGRPGRKGAGAGESYIAAQTRRLSQGQINRRRFVMSALATGVTLPTALSLATKAEARVPRRGGLLRLGMAQGTAADRLDPAVSANAFSRALVRACADTLTEVAASGAVAGSLAERIEASADARTWVFDLRRGVEFHDGRTLTSADVVASLERHRGATLPGVGRSLLSGVSRIRAEGPARVIVELATAHAGFAALLSDEHLAILPADAEGRVDATSGTGTGGYVLRAFEPGRRAAFTRNPNDWKLGRAHFEAVELMSLPDATLRQSAVMTGEIDFADTIDPRTVALMSRMPTLAIRETAGSRACTFPMRLDTGPFGNADLRRALKLAIRRQELVDKVLLGHGRPGNDAPVPDTALPARDFDPDRAAALFRASGHSGPLRLTVSEAAFPGAIDAARLIAASAAEAGIAIEVAAVPAEGYWSEVWNRQSWCAAHWARRATPDLAFATGYLPGAAWNDTGWRGTASAAAFEDRVRAARAETDEARRAGLHAEAQHLLHEEGGLILPIWANDIAAHGRALASPDTTSPADASEVIGTWWFA